MFYFAILIGIYSYCIFFLGVAHFLYKELIIAFTMIGIILIGIFNKQMIYQPLQIVKFIYKIFKQNKFFQLLILLFLLQSSINLVGALGPEISFDALWYHLTLPKIFLENQKIFHIDGGLLYYSDMPKLTEMLYISALSINNEILAKIIHFSFGLASCIVLYKISRMFVSPLWSLVSVIVFYSNLVVGWQSITAYIDLSRTFFELLALYSFLLFSKSKRLFWLMISALMMGLAITSKLLALSSLPIYIFLLYIMYFRNISYFFPRALFYVGVSFLIPSPWFLFSFIHTGNPIYPFFTTTYPIDVSHILDPLSFFRDVLSIFLYSSDPVSPIYLIILPLVFIYRKKIFAKRKVLLLYCLFSFILWWITPRTGGGRFLLSYLPAFSVLVSVTLSCVRDKFFLRVLVGVIVLLSTISITYRGIANARFIPVILGQESKDVFLSKNLNYSFGDFYDIDRYFKKNITMNDKVLIFGFHNLYYANFPFIHETYIKHEDKFNYILTQNQELPEKFKDWDEVYRNDTTSVRLYTKNNQWWNY